MRRRSIGLAVTLAGGLLLVQLAAEAQQAGPAPSVASLHFPCHRPGWSELFLPPETLRRALREAGYLDYLVDACANDRANLSTVAADLVRLRMSVIIAVGTEAVQAAKQATRNIPIAMVSVSDPVEAGFVASLAKPSGNVTGVFVVTSNLGEKRLEWLKEVLPKLSHVAVLWNPDDVAAAREWRQTQVAARALGVTLKSFEVRTPEDLDSAFLVLTQLDWGALITAPDPLTRAQGRRIVEFAAWSRLPSMYGAKVLVEAGGLMAYEPSTSDLARRVAIYVDKILKGAKPADLPVEQATKFELVINLKTAKTLGLTIPQAVLLRADEVIE